MDTLTVPGIIESLDLITDYVLDAAAKATLTPKQVYRLRLAVDEIATNVITHGYIEAGRSGDITIFARFENDFLIIVLKDTGESYDPTQDFCLQEKCTPPEKRSVAGGLGNFIAISSVDHFQYECFPSYNCSTFIINRQ
ncbi:MAG: ATP-binding protein [Chloroflexi bacterium]|nr:ATP-binding protein [Chloroflexota bacterium]